jgi:hypothetical protein
MTALLALLLAPACDRGGYDLIPQPNDNFPGVQNLGEVTVGAGTEAAVYGTLGPPLPGAVGGATATFTGTGGDVCVVVDPESVFWAQSVAVQGQKEKYSYPDNYQDDGDIDLEVGLSAFYTGSPGVEMGGFEAVYEDSLGTEVFIEYNECTIFNYLSDPEGHAGRGTVESCTIDTSAHPGKSYTVVLTTWSLPIDDDLLQYAFAIFDGDCSSVSIDECFLPGEVNAVGQTPADETPGEEAEERQTMYSELEQAYCNGEQNIWCEENADWCGPLDD